MEYAGSSPVCLDKYWVISKALQIVVTLVVGSWLQGPTNMKPVAWGQGQPKAKQLAMAPGQCVAPSSQGSRNASPKREQKTTDLSSKNQGQGNVHSKDVQILG